MTGPVQLQERGNNFGALRVYAALAVLFSHSFPLSYGTSRQEPLWVASRHQTTFGGVAVAVFFIISGYLITQSYLRTGSPLRFLWSRGLRLLPGLATALIGIGFVLGPILTAEPLAAYFRDPGTFRFVIVNLSLISFVDGLPDVFAHLPFHDAVNGSLWTLGYEARCYGLVLLLGVAGWLNRWTVLAVFGALLLASKAWIGGDLIQFGSLFAGGAMMYFWRPPLKAPIAALCAVVLAASLATGGFRLAAATAGAYLVIFAVFAPVRLPATGRMDLSYGIYIWAFPIQQTATLLLGAAAAWWANILISAPIVIGLAWLSWHLVEARALSLKDAWWGYLRRSAD